MTIKWYPGHMNKAKTEIADVIRKIDVVIEVVDARLPSSSENPILNTLRGDKPCIKMLNKSDLADPIVTELWLAHYKSLEGITAISVNAGEKSQVGKLPDLCRKFVIVPTTRPLKAMVVGIPNVGKSTLINTLAGRRVARVGDKPAITRHQQRICLPNRVDLFDTPGILWPDLEDQEGALRLAASGAIGSAAMDHQDVAWFAGKYLLENYREMLQGRYGIDDSTDDPFFLLEEIGRRRGCLRRGGIVDLQKASEVFLNELKGGQIGRISFERPEAQTEPEIQTEP